jgi:hypothetical protein
MLGSPITKKDIIGILVFVAIIWFIAIPLIRRWQEKTSQIDYAANIKKIYKVIQRYGEQKGKYPASEKWCDELVERMNLPDFFLFCGAAGDPLYYDTMDSNAVPNLGGGRRLLSEEIDVNGQRHYFYQFKWSHYAFNPNAEPNSPGDVVLLFSTKGGWNRFGESEIFCAENYKGIGRVGGYVLFNNGNVKFVKPNEILKLNWGKDNKTSK